MEITPEHYQSILHNPDALLKLQDPLDALFQKRIIEVRNNLRELGWRGEIYQQLTKDGVGLKMNLSHIGAGRNVVKVTWSLCELVDGENQPTKGTFVDDLSLDSKALAAQMDLVVSETKQVESVEFDIGTQFMSRGKNKSLCTVVDIFKTYNHKGELVRTRYVATHEFLGQTVTDRDVLGITIQRGLVKND